MIVAPCRFVFLPVSLAGRRCMATGNRRGKPAKTAKTQKSCMIRIPVTLRQRLARIGKAILAAKERGQGFDDIPLLRSRGRRRMGVLCRRNRTGSGRI